MNRDAVAAAATTTTTTTAADDDDDDYDSKSASIMAVVGTTGLDYEEEMKTNVQARIEAQLEMLEARPQVLNSHLQVVGYDGGEAGIGYEVENVLEFSRTPLHRSGSSSVNSTLVLKCREPLLLDYVRIGTSAHCDFALRSGVIWLYASEHKQPQSEGPGDSCYRHMFHNCKSAEEFDRICSDVDAIRIQQKRTSQDDENVANSEKADLTDPAKLLASGEELKSNDATINAANAASDGVEIQPGEFPDCFYFETDPVTYTTTVALRNRSRIDDMEKYIRGVFAEIDVNGDGELSMEELVPPLIKMGYSARFARKIIRDADDDGNGVIDADEFTAHMSKLNISSDAATCEATFVVVLMTSVHDNARRTAESARRLMGEDVVDETPTVSFVQQLVDAGYGAPPSTIQDGRQDDARDATQSVATQSDTKYNSPRHSSSEEKESSRPPSVTTEAIHQEKRTTKAKRNAKTKKQKGELTHSYPPYMQCSFMCFCGHTKNKRPREPDPEPLFDHEFFKPRHLRRPFVNVAPPKMAPMPAPGPQVLPTLNVFDNDFMAHLNKSPCVIVYCASADQMIANKARRTAANLAKEFKDPAYPRQEMIRPTEQELEDGAQPYQQPRFLPQDLKFFEINDTHSMAPTVAHMFQILTTPRVLVVYSQPWKRNICFALEGSSLTTFTDANVRPFLHNFCSGALAPIDKTQAFAIPPPNGSLQKINGQSFSDVVMDDSKDVLVYYHTRISNQSEGDMKQVAELLGVMFTLRVVSFDLDENDIPFHLLQEAQGRWRTECAAVGVARARPCTFVQRTGIALYNRGDGKQFPIWKRGFTDVLSIIDFVRQHCTVTFDFSPNSYFRLKFDLIRSRDELLWSAHELLRKRDAECEFLREIAAQKVEEERLARLRGVREGERPPEEEVGPDGQPLATPGGGRALAKFVSTVYTDSARTATELKEAMQRFEKQLSTVRAAEAVRQHNLIKRKVKPNASNAVRVGVHSSDYRPPERIARLKNVLDASLHSLLVEARFLRNREVTLLPNGRAWLQAYKFVGERPLVGLFVRNGCKVCQFVREQYLQLSTKYAPEIKFVMLNIDGADADESFVASTASATSNISTSSSSGSMSDAVSSPRTETRAVGDTFPLLDEMLLETPAFALYYRQKCVEKFCGADLDRLKRQLDRLRAIYRHAEATKIAQDVIRSIVLPRWSDATEMVNALKSVPVEASHVEEANEANVRGGFAAMSMETRGNMSFLGPELIAKGFRDLEQLHTVACKATDRGESLVHLFKIFCPSKTKPKGAGSYLARVQEAVDKAIRAKNRELLGTASTAGRPRSSSSRSRSRRGSP